MKDLPSPPVATDVDLRDFPFTPLYRARLFGSAFHARVNDAEWRAGVTLWLKSQDQCPAGSLPDDDIELCRLAELGRDIKKWKKIKAGALHGWFKSSDGRLYNKVVAELVTEQWRSKVGQRIRTATARISKLERRLAHETDLTALADINHQLQAERQRLACLKSQTQHWPVTDDVTVSATGRVTGPVTGRVTVSATGAVTSSVTGPVTGSKRREGTVKGQGIEDSLPGGSLSTLGVV